MDEYPTVNKKTNDGEPDLQTSPMGDSLSPKKSPFQTDIDISLKIPDNIEYVTPDAVNSLSADGTVIADHSGFAFAGDYSGGGSKAAVIVAVIMLVLGLALGGFAVHYYYFGFKISAEQSAGIDAINSVYDYANKSGVEKVVFTDVYVNSKTEEYECMVFTVVKYSLTESKAAGFRVVSPKGGGKTEIFPEFDQSEFDRLNYSSSEVDNLNARLLLTQKNEYERCLDEILAGKWVSVDPSYTSARITRREK